LVSHIPFVTPAPCRGPRFSAQNVAFFAARWTPPHGRVDEPETAATQIDGGARLV
jgi:hypothetical protein